jgi:hypothetical protein
LGGSCPQNKGFRAIQSTNLADGQWNQAPEYIIGFIDSINGLPEDIIVVWASQGELATKGLQKRTPAYTRRQPKYPNGAAIIFKEVTKRTALMTCNQLIHEEGTTSRLADRIITWLCRRRILELRS